MSPSLATLLEDWQESPAVAARGLGSHIAPQGGSFSKHQTNAILIATLACASISLVAALVSLRWFLLMKKSFRHQLVLYLIASDAFKAVWYFIFPVVVFTRGPVHSSSRFCHASGFFLALGIEASDFAIVLIALHSILYIFRPTSKTGEGGLYPYRRWIYPFWLGPPLLAASLAFVNGHDAYVTAGTFCYLPKRPFWYRLALSWIPRYLIISTIFVMYGSIYIYVRIKFRGFHNLGQGHLSYESNSDSRTASIPGPNTPSMLQGAFERTRPFPRPQSVRMHSFNSGKTLSRDLQRLDPWDQVEFVTAQLQPGIGSGQANGVGAYDFGRGSASSGVTAVAPRQLSTQYEEDEISPADGRKVSDVPTLGTTYTGDTAATYSIPDTIETLKPVGTTDELRITRLAIRRQLRFLFIYPAIYVVMWTFPFANHALNYSDYYVTHPLFWLSILSNSLLALQAGVDSVVFSWREKPWKRIDQDSKLSIPFLHRHSKALVCRMTDKTPTLHTTAPSVDNTFAQETRPQAAHLTHWWEAEGRKRKDSVWMGTDALTRVHSEGHESV